MTTPAPFKLFAWLPLTPRGIAVYAQAAMWRLLLAQGICALCSAIAVGTFLGVAWFPTISAAIHGLPTKGEIQSATLIWAEPAPVMLASGHFLAVSVDPNHSGAVRAPSQVQVEFGRHDLRILSLFGYTDLPYPNGWIVSLNQPELEPKWGAWATPILWLASAVAFCGLLLVWAVLAVCYSFPVRLLGFFLNRKLDFAPSWKISGAAMMPGAMVMIVATVFYAFQVLNLVQFLAAVGVHFVVQWIFLVAGVFCLPGGLSAKGGGGNPFARPTRSDRAARDSDSTGSGSK